MNKPFESFKFNKAFGQNFISNKNLLNAIVADSGISCSDSVLEIGTGAGALTTAIAEKAKKVVSYEIDKKLIEFLTEKFREYDNVKIIFADALKLPIEQIDKEFENSYHIIANLPYYITTPLIFKFLEETNKVLSLTIMVQKEVAEKVVAKFGNKNYGAISITLQYYYETKVTRIVNRKMFNPIPKVDSAVLHLKRKPDIVYDENFNKFIIGIFAMKRKTLVNNLVKIGLEKNIVLQVLDEEKIKESERAENLTISQIRNLYIKFYK